MKKAAVPSILVVVVLLAVAVIAEAQQPRKMPRIGYLSSVPLTRPLRAAFRAGVRELGYVEGKNMLSSTICGGQVDRLPALADELVGLKVDVIVTWSPTRPVPPRMRPRRFPS